MWVVEYELQEPSIEGRAIVGEAVDASFDPNLGVFEGEPDEYIELEEPVTNAEYATGVDWAKEQDWTVIATYRTDLRRPDGGLSWKLVAWERTGRMEWPVMVRRYEDRLRRYRPSVDDRTKKLSTAHDATGLGDVIDDYLAVEIDGARPWDVKLVGERRAGIFEDYIAAVEDGVFERPRIRFAYDEHRYVTRGDLYTRSGHPPDSFVADAVAWFTRSTAPIEAVAPASHRGESRFRGRR